MNKEEFEQLKSTVKQWLFHTGSLDPTNYANELKLKFIEPREKRIIDLEWQLQEVVKDNDNYQAENKRLEKENAELTAKNKWYSEQVCNKECAEVWGNLTKAKELIEDMYDKIPSSHSDYYKDVMERARQFLKEIEK